MALTALARHGGASGLGLALSLVAATPLHPQDLDAATARVPLDSALTIARAAATAAFPELDDYVLYSVTPRVLRGDPGGFHWQVLWQALAFPHRDRLVVRVYMNDGHASTERGRAPGSGTPE